MNKNNVLDHSIIIIATFISLVTLSLCTLTNCTSAVQDKEVPQLPSTTGKTPTTTNNLLYFPRGQLTTEEHKELKDSDIIYTMQVFLYDEKGKMKEQLTLKPSDKR
jgi:hypothetical protein